jgi:hypothetical protein
MVRSTSGPDPPYNDRRLPLPGEAPRCVGRHAAHGLYEDGFGTKKSHIHVLEVTPVTPGYPVLDPPRRMMSCSLVAMSSRVSFPAATVTTRW